MAIDLDKINNLFSDRYRSTLKVIQGLHKMIENNEYEDILAGGEKLAPYALNKMLQDQELDQ